MTLGIVIDSETTGLWRNDLSPDASEQPSLLQISAKLIDLSTRRREGRWSAIVRPEGWSIEPAAEAIHGISQARAYAVGLPLAHALMPLAALVRATGNDGPVIGHNVEFDRRVITAAIRRANGSGDWWFAKANEFYCTMHGAAPILKIPGKFGDWKWPSLEEAVNGIAHLPPFGSWKATHDADSDVDACEAIYWAIQDRLAENNRPT